MFIYLEEVSRMKNYFSRWFFWLLLSLGGLMFAGGCASDQQGQEEVQSEDEQQDVDNEEDENQNNENEEENNQNFENLENQNADNNINEGNAAQFEGNQLGLDQGNESQQGDLQEIIEEMNEGGDQLAAQDQGMQAQGGWPLDKLEINEVILLGEVGEISSITD